MDIWRFRSFSNDFAGLYPVDDADVWADTFEIDGTPKAWSVRPRVTPILEKNKKKQKPLGDIEYITAGSVVLNQKAYAVLKVFLLPFGQFLEVECLNGGGLLGDSSIQSQVYYLYNVTNMISCIDTERTKGMMAWEKPTFVTSAIPQDLQVFKDPFHKHVEIYLTGPAKERLEQLIAEAGLTGAVFEQVA